MRQDARGKQVPLQPNERKRIIYYLKESCELTVVEIARIFRRDVSVIQTIMRHEGIKRRKLDVIR